MNLIIKSKLVNRKAITGGYWLTGILSKNATSTIIIGTPKLQGTLNSLILKGNMIFKMILPKNAET